MGFLKIFGIVLKYDESKKYFKIIRDNFVKYVIRELKKDMSVNNHYLVLNLNFIKYI